MKRLLFLCLSAMTAMMSMAQPQAGYYVSSALDGKNGRELELALRDIVYPHARISYGELWNSYVTTDTAPLDSVPDGCTKTDLVYDMYAWMKYFPKFHSDNDHSQTGGINREHSVPNSWWGGESGNAEAYTDLHHLVPADGAANNVKSNYPLGEKAENDGLTLSWPTQDKYHNGHLYVSKDHVCSRVWNVPSEMQDNFGDAAKLWEPADIYKGDFARMYLYVVCAYEGEIHWQTNYMFASDDENLTTIKPWALELLLRWHRNDTVSQKELDRNNVVENIQGNRNPFIDYPELVEFIWGDLTSEEFDLGKAKCSYGELPYSVDENKNDDFFAYQNGNSLIINAEGTVQVIDMMGRILINENIFKNHIDISYINKGVYIVRVVGKDVMTQKIVVR